MPAPDLHTPLREHLEALIFPPTNRPLGQAGTQFTVLGDEQAPQVTVKLGFPAQRSAAALAQLLVAHCGKQADLPVPTVTFDTVVEAHAVQHGLKPIDGVKNIIAVASGKGGVGKSTLAVNLAIALAQEGAVVGLLDADIYGPSQPTMLGLVDAKPQSEDGQRLEPLVAHGIQSMSIGYLVDQRQPMAWRGPMVTSALNQLLMQTNWQNLDYLFVDMPPGTGDIQLTLAQRVPVSGAVITTTPQEVALADARKAIEMFQKVNVPVLGVIENMSVHVCTHCGHAEPIFGQAGGQRLGDEYELPLLGQMPLTSEIRRATDLGNPTVAAAADEPIANLFRETALRIVGELAATAKDYSLLFPKITVETDE